MAEQTRGTRFALVEESTEGTPVKPSSGADYLALQEGFTMAPDFEVLENEEIRASIGAAKPILGQENPTYELSHYMRHSGTVATTPDQHLLYKNAFGTTATRATERDTIAASTTTVVKVDAAASSEFQLGDALLVKHAGSAHEIAIVDSVSTDDLTLAFALQNAPATSTNLGRNVVYRPANTRGSLTAWLYRSDGAAVEMVAGSKVGEMTIEAEAGQLINSTFSGTGLEFFFNPIEIESTDTKLDFTVTGPSTVAATITAKMYKDPHDLASAVQTAMNAAQTTDTITVSYSNSTGKYTISSDGTLLSLLWSTGTNTANTIGDKLGFDIADDTGATTYTADNTIVAPGASVTAGDLGSPDTPTLDSTNPLAAKDNEVFLGAATGDNACFSTQSFSATLSNELTPVPDICATSGRSGQVSAGRTFEVELTANLTRFDAEQFKDFRQGNEVKFQFNFGTKSGGNWEEGKSGSLFVNAATISSFEVTDTDGIVTLALTLTAFIDASGNNDVFLNFL